jgi:hypothetical protein
VQDVPDSAIDLTDLWEEVRMANARKKTVASTGKGTTAYSNILYRLGIDIIENWEPKTKPPDIYDESQLNTTTLEYDNLQSEEQLEAVALELTRNVGLNEATFAARLI